VPGAPSLLPSSLPSPAPTPVDLPRSVEEARLVARDRLAGGRL